MSKNIFITYNPKSESEESTALRLQTISNLYGLNILLPYRIGTTGLSLETKSRIDKSYFVVSFCIERLSKQQKEDLTFAIQQKKAIIVLYDANKDVKINFKGVPNVKEIHVDFTKTDEALHNIADFLRKKLVGSSVNKVTRKKQDDESGLGIALLSIGLGLLAAWTFSNEKR